MKNGQESDAGLFGVLGSRGKPKRRPIACWAALLLWSRHSSRPGSAAKRVQDAAVHPLHNGAALFDTTAALTTQGSNWPA
jgi:hypothetical protein